MLGRIKSRIRRVGSGNSTGSGGGEPDPLFSRRAPKTPLSFVEASPLGYNAKLTDLASFDACVEACDALAASSSYAQSSAKTDRETGMKDCSVLVSPDGDLLLVPQESTRTEKKLQEPADDNVNDAIANSNDADTNGTQDSPKSQPQSPYSTFLASRKDSDDYNSAVIMGYDLQSKGDYTLNGFSAMGWSAAATSLAIRQSEQALREMTGFMEELITTKKEHAARAANACDHLRHMSEHHGEAPPLPIPSSIRKNGAPKRRVTSAEALFSLSELEPIGKAPLELASNRVGPLSYRGGTIHAATVAFEQYLIMMAESDANRWRMASHGSLAEIRLAADKAAERSYHRERSLKDMQSRANEIEARLVYCKTESSRRWQLVHEAEELVTKVMEDHMLERSRERERQRLEQYRLDEEAHAKDRSKAHLGATQAEVWDMIAAAADSFEDGSFTPLDLPQAPLKGPRDRSMQAAGEPSTLTMSTSQDSIDSSIPFASRSEIEQRCNLPGLRASALAADEAIEDTAGSLLNVLSNLDTTRRSARVAAETCLLSACHAQSTCLKSLVQMERASIEERLRSLIEVERIVEGMDARLDLDAYITNDKSDRGGSTWLGDDDDGGIASALAVLSSHVDGSLGHISPNRMASAGWDDEEEDEEEITPEQLEDAVDNLFCKDFSLMSDKTREDYERNAAFLCKVAEDRKHVSSRSRRSTICYALNAKRTSAEMECQLQFDALAKVIYSVLTACDQEAGGVANAKMCMMLSQSFFINTEAKEPTETSPNSESPNRNTRDKRIYVKSQLIDHPLWQDEEFWDQALFQCVTESLTHSGVMANFERGGGSTHRSEWTETRKLKWHDLSHSERSEASSQVHAVVFAQLGALAHSMIEFGCGLERSCAFVRRMSVRNQLPISQRTMLLIHLVGEQTASNACKEAS